MSQTLSNKKNIKTLNQKDVFPNIETLNVDFEDRLTGKAIIIDSEQKIALVGTTVNFI